MGIESVMLNHTRKRRPSVASRRDFLVEYKIFISLANILKKNALIVMNGIQLKWLGTITRSRITSNKKKKVRHKNVLTLPLN